MSSEKHAFHRIVMIAAAIQLVLGFAGFPSTTALAADEIVSGLCGEAELFTALINLEIAGGGTLTFDCGPSPFSIVLTSHRTISSPITIDGGGLATLSGGNATRIFVVEPGASLTLKNITISNGSGSGGDGGAVYNSGSLTIDNTRFLSNSVGLTQSGGAIVSYGPLTIQNSSLFSNNTAGAGGALYTRYATAVTLITDSAFEQNKALNPDSAAWGGVLLAWDGAQVTVKRSTFSSNEANHSGGALALFGSSSMLMEDSTLAYNEAWDNGGALHIQGAATITDTLIAHNTGWVTGGGLYNAGGTVLVRTTLLDNFTLGTGGGIRNAANAELFLRRSLVIENIAEEGGGLSNPGYAEILNSVFSANVAHADWAMGGAVSSGGSISINFTTFVDNRTIGTSAEIGETLHHFGPSFFNLKNSLIQSEYEACSGVITSQGYNLASDETCSLSMISDWPSTNAGLTAWFASDGASLKILPSPGSPAIDSAQCSMDIPVDYRGLLRPAGLACEIGALERHPSDPKAYIHLPAVMR